MCKINFTKMVASGNDFVVIDYGLRITNYACLPDRQGLQSLAKRICDRKFGVGADGVLLLERSPKANVRMRIFNADGSEAEMCGNGARCAALYISRPSSVFRRSSNHLIQTKAGKILYEVKGGNVKIKLTDPKDIRLDIPVKINNFLPRRGGFQTRPYIKVNFINTGVPHTVVFVEGLEGIDVFSLGRQIRYHQAFAPAGTNVDFVEVLDEDTIKVRTYERGVEDETLACGTGSVASALAYALKSSVHLKINVHTAGGEILKVYFKSSGNNFKNVWLEGLARIVYTGVYNV